jgi:hypothetical protein
LGIDSKPPPCSLNSRTATVIGERDLIEPGRGQNKSYSKSYAAYIIHRHKNVEIADVLLDSGAVGAGAYG